MELVTIYMPHMPLINNQHVFAVAVTKNKTNHYPIWKLILENIIKCSSNHITFLNALTMKNIKVRFFLARTNQDRLEHSEFTRFLGHSITCIKDVGFSCPIHLPGGFTKNNSCGIFVSK